MFLQKYKGLGLEKGGETLDHVIKGVEMMEE